MPGRRLDLTRFDEPDILFCRLCETHLSLGQNIIGPADLHVEDPFVQIRAMANIVVCDRGIIVAGHQDIAQVTCRLCSQGLGFRIVRMVDDGDAHDVTVQYVISAKLSILRNGHQLMSALTRSAVFGDWRFSLRPFVIPLDGNFYQCRWCSSHVALLEHEVIQTRSPEFQIFMILYNTHTGKRSNRADSPQANDVHCSSCYRKLGSKNAVIGSPLAHEFRLDSGNLVFKDAVIQSAHLRELSRLALRRIN